MGNNGNVSFSVGICASDNPSNLPHLIQQILEARLDENVILNMIIVVASACSPKILPSIRAMARSDSRVHLIEEEERHGKADALNKIIQAYSGEYLVFINADANPAKDALSQLMKAILNDPYAGVISAKPVMDSTKQSATGVIEELMWDVHNASSLLLNHMHISNHSSDEMMVVRSNILEFFPNGLVNDGAYIGSRAKSKGYLVKFCENARVRIQTPSTINGLIGQRRRILYGHIQIKQIGGNTPKTVESLLITSPKLSIQILGSLLSSNPSRILLLPIAFFTESISGALAIFDSLTSKNKHGVWRRYDS